MPHSSSRRARPPLRPLTPQQQRILELHDQGLGVKRIAKLLGLRHPRNVQHALTFALVKAGRGE